MAKNLKDKQTLYMQVFKTEAAKEVLADLRDYCYATKTTHVKDDTKRSDMNEGRREVFMQIMSTIKIDYEEYYDYDPEDYE